MKHYLFPFLIFLSLTSCKTLLLKAMLKDPKVENTASIKAFQESNHFSTTNSLIFKGDTGAVEKDLLQAFEGYQIFNANGQLISYNGSATCTGTQFRQLIANQSDSFHVIESDSITLQKVLSRSYDLQEQKVTATQFPKSDYYVVAYWTKFWGGKRGYEDNIGWMEDLIQKDTGNTHFTMIKINTDMQEKWGLMPGEKANLKFKRSGDDLSLSIENIPIRK